MPPTKRARAKARKKIRITNKRHSKRQKTKAVISRKTKQKKGQPLRIPSSFNVNRRPKPKPKPKRSNNLRRLLNKYNYMNVGARQPSNNLIRFDPEERARAQKPLIERREFKKLLNRHNYMDVGARQPSNNLIRFDPEERARAQKHIMARRTQNLRNFLHESERRDPERFYRSILPNQGRDHFNEYDKKYQQRLKLRKLGEEMLKIGQPVDSLTQYSPMIREMNNIDPYDLDAELGITNYNQSKTRGIKKSVINKIRGRE
jgi:hypothetical protein